MSSTPTVIIDARGVKRLKQGHLWIYASDVLNARNATGGDVVALTDERGHPYGYAFYSDASQITLRWCAPPGPPPDRDFWLARFLAADAYRKQVVHDSNAYRYIYSEGDLLSSLIIDRYDKHFVIQTLAQGTERLKGLWVELLQELFSPDSIVERNDTPVRQHENLPQQTGVLAGSPPDEVTIHMNGLELGVELIGGHKTGAFLDQRENYAAAARYAKGRVLDAFTFAGGFGLHAARHGAGDVLAVDISEDACALARRNADRNNIQKMVVLRANVFDYLHELDRMNERFDTIILDPPAFAKNKASLPTAFRGYKEINLRALRLLNPGGILVTCSCSYHVSDQLFTEMLVDAMGDVGRPLRIIEQRLQSRDHPVLLGVPETKYLKCIIAQVLE
jgi:23S rRNA (cytosine1962-C5)-methyltransferase